MAVGTFNLSNPRNLLFDAILAEIRSWAELPRRIFMQAHYGGRRVEDIASDTGRSTQEIAQILDAHESRLRRALRAFRIG